MEISPESILANRQSTVLLYRWFAHIVVIHLQGAELHGERNICLVLI